MIELFQSGHWVLSFKPLKEKFKHEHNDYFSDNLKTKCLRKQSFFFQTR